MRDCEGKELSIGDKVAYVDGFSGGAAVSLATGYITRFTATKAVLVSGYKIKSARIVLLEKKKEK